MARNRTPKQRRAAHRRTVESRPARIHVKRGARGMSFSRLSLFTGSKERETAVRFYRFIGVETHMSDHTGDWPRLDEMYAGLGRIQKSKLERARLKAIRRRLIAQAAGNNQ
jgi:hypothetical protein